MIRLRCACGRQLQARDSDAARLAVCPVCGKTTTVPQRDRPQGPAGPLAGENGAITAQAPRRETGTAGQEQPQIVVEGPNRLATASVVLGVLSFFAALTSLPAVLLGALALRKVARAKGAVGGKGKAIAGIVLGCLGVVLLPLLLLGNQRLRERADRAQDRSNLERMVLAFHAHQDAHGHFPAATAFYTKDGKPGLSWRVALLPYLGEEALFKEFHLDEAWDSPHNIQLLDRMPKVYHLPGSGEAEPGLTSYQVFVGPNTPFRHGLRDGRPGGSQGVPEAGPRIPEHFFRGTSNTFLIAPARYPVPWTKPADLAYDQTRPLPPLGGHFRGGFNVGLADGSTYWIDGRISEATRRQAIESEAFPLSSDWQ
jgi:hypothetical protein